MAVSTKRSKFKSVQRNADGRLIVDIGPIHNLQASDVSAEIEVMRACCSYFVRALCEIPTAARCLAGKRPDSGRARS